MLKKTEKLEITEDLKKELKNADGFVVANFKGLNVADFSDLRRQIRGVGGASRVVKNRLLKRALDEMEVKGVDPYLKENTVLIYSQSDIMGALKVLALFARDHKEFALKGGFVSGMAYDNTQVVEISKLPGRLELIASIAGGLNSVVGMFAGALNAIMVKFVGTVEALEKKKA